MFESQRPLKISIILIICFLVISCAFFPAWKAEIFTQQSVSKPVKTSFYFEQRKDCEAWLSKHPKITNESRRQCTWYLTGSDWRERQEGYKWGGIHIIESKATKFSFGDSVSGRAHFDINETIYRSPDMDTYRTSISDDPQNAVIKIRILAQEEVEFNPYNSRLMLDEHEVMADSSKVILIFDEKNQVYTDKAISDKYLLLPKGEVIDFMIVFQVSPYILLESKSLALSLSKALVLPDESKVEPIILHEENYYIRTD